MNRENYEILQVEETASDEEIRAAYERLKAQYNEDKWQDGEEGKGTYNDQQDQPPGRGDRGGGSATGQILHAAD